MYKRQVYYCPFCKTGLAQEEVQGDGTHERCGNVVERRNLPQWIFRIQEYADSLLDGLDGLDWPKGILEMQRNWIGKKEGIEITYPVVVADGGETGETITCFTTRPETNFGATFIAVSYTHLDVYKRQVLSCGPPCKPGKTARSISFGRLGFRLIPFSVTRITAPLGPRSVL